MTPLKAIRAKCMDCCCGQYKEVELCPCKDCSLYPYRFGKNPNIKLTEEQRAARVLNLKSKPKGMGDSIHETAGTTKDISQPFDGEKEA